MTSSLPVMLISTATVTVTVKCPGNKGMHAEKYRMILSLILSLILVVSKKKEDINYNFLNDYSGNIIL